METDVVPICRVCLETLNEYIDMESLFFLDQTEASKDVSSTTAELESNDLKNLTYMDCFRECTHLNVEIKGHCTQGICVPCSLDLRLAYEFLKKAETAAEYYEKYTKKSLKQFQDEQMLNQEYSMVETVIEESDEKLEVTDGLSEIEEFPLSESQNEEDDIVDIFEAKYRASEEDNEQSGMETFLEVTTIDIDEIKKEYANEEDHTITPISKEITLVGNVEKPKRKRRKTSKLNEEKHENMKPASNKDNYLCYICSKSFSSKGTLNGHLKYHMRKQLNIKSDACKTCGKTFVDSSSLRKHVQLHKNERMLHECDQCGKIYRQKSSLDSHKILHSSEAPKCLECGKKFSRPNELRIHMRFHTHDFPFVCEICGRNFAIKCHLRAHMWRHQGLKFQCQDCGKLFKTSRALLDHSFKHTEMPFQCCYCPKGYPSKPKFRIHLRTAHSIELNEEELRKVTGVIAKQPVVRRKHILVQVDNQENE